MGSEIFQSLTLTQTPPSKTMRLLLFLAVIASLHVATWSMPQPQEDDELKSPVLESQNSESTPEPEAESEPSAEPEAESEPYKEHEPKSEPESEPEVEPESEPEAEPESEPYPESDNREPKAAAQPVTKSNSAASVVGHTVVLSIIAVSGAALL